MRKQPETPAQWRRLVELTREIERTPGNIDAGRRALDAASILFPPMAPGSPRQQTEPEWHALAGFFTALRKALTPQTAQAPTQPTIFRRRQVWAARRAAEEQGRT